LTTFKNSRFRLQKDLLQRPTMTPEQEAVWKMVEKAGSPQAAAQDLVSRLVALEEAVARLEHAEGAVEEGQLETTSAEPETSP